MHGTLYSLGNHNETQLWTRPLQKCATLELVAQTGISCLTRDCSLLMCQKFTGGMCPKRLLPLAEAPVHGP